MLQRLNTMLLLAILAAVVWFGLRRPLQPQIGRYTPATWHEESGILDTATGELIVVGKTGEDIRGIPGLSHDS